MKFRIVSDDDGHNYIIPANKLTDWWAWGENLEDNDYDVPEWAERIDDPSTIIFGDWERDYS